jgi:hypothetical protein
VKWPRFSISTTMVLVIGLAIDFALIRQTLVNDGPLAQAIYRVFFMANVLAYGIYRLIASGGKCGPFLKGFVACGLLSVLAHLGCEWMFPATMAGFYEIALNPLGKLYDKHMPPSYPQSLELLLWPFIMFSISAIIALPQLLLALIGGWLSSRFKVVRRIPKFPISSPHHSVAR